MCMMKKRQCCSVFHTNLQFFFQMTFENSKSIFETSQLLFKTALLRCTRKLAAVHRENQEEPPRACF